MNKYLTESEQALLLNHIKKWADDKAQRDYHIVSALMHSGMRIGEFLNITVADVIDAFKTGSLYIPTEHRKGGFLFLRWQGKKCGKRFFLCLLSARPLGERTIPRFQRGM